MGELHMFCAKAKQHVKTDKSKSRRFITVDLMISNANQNPISMPKLKFMWLDKRPGSMI